MAGSAKTVALSVATRAMRALLLASLVSFSAPAEPTISLEDAMARKAPDFTPLYEDRQVVVAGQVSMKAAHLATYVHLPIQEKEHGLVLEGTGAIFDRLLPGDWVEAQGKI